MRRFTIDELKPWIEERFESARGPGGQNVNKVSTRCVLRFDFRSCTLLTDAQRERLGRRCASRLTRDGRLQVSAERARTQPGNRRAAATRLLELLAEGLHVPRPRRPTRPTLSSQRRRLAAKRRRGEIKRQRRQGPGPEE